MKSILFTLLLCILFIVPAMAQESQVILTYREIPAYPAKYRAGTVAARVIDGLGFRYYWATEGLKDADLNFRPNEKARTSLETIRHIYELSNVIARTVIEEDESIANDIPITEFTEMRNRTLQNLKTASDILRVARDKEMKNFNIGSRNANSGAGFPFWNLLNGPIADALWHTGQVVSFRRSSGNPINPKVNVFIGNLRE
ncbi:MAG TPA: hypothetical protein VI583_09950 [Cyclobacteriaceae bacterium]|nr:hypothetical protein [Cyclobacteriaceae bacterium]